VATPGKKTDDENGFQEEGGDIQRLGDDGICDQPTIKAAGEGVTAISQEIGVMNEQNAAHFVGVEDGAAGELPDGGAEEDVEEIVAAAFQDQVEPVRLTRHPGEGEQYEENKGFVMNLPEDISQEQVEGEVADKGDPGPGG